MRKFIAEKTQTLRDFTDEHYAQGSFAFARLARARDIRVSGARVGANVTVHAGEEVCYFTTPKEEARPFYTVVYEDADALVADKFAGVNTEALAFHLAAECGARAVHRLDRNTCGLLVFAKTDAAERALLSAFRERRVKKVYEALCFGPFAKPKADLAAYLQKDAEHARVRVSTAPAKGAVRIETSYEVTEDCGAYARVRIVLGSGKTHQIRAHMAFVGNPVVGDEKYGDEAKNASLGVRRHILVAKELSFDCPALAGLHKRTFVSAFRAELPAR